MEEHFTIDIPCKSYIRSYLETNCGIPADLAKLPDLLTELRRCLKGKPGEMNRKIIANYPDNVKIIIPTRVFYRDGWELNKQNILEFNKYVEIRLKFLMRNFIALSIFMGLSQTEAIREFQESFGFDDQVWAFDSIKKDFYRNKEAMEVKTLKEMRTKMKKIFLTNLSQNGTVSADGIKRYCNG